LPTIPKAVGSSVVAAVAAAAAFKAWQNKKREKDEDR
jgi:hypothetical protein